MIRSILSAALFLSAVAPSLAQSQPAPPEYTQQALVQMVQEAQGREAQALVQVYALKAQINGLQAQLVEQTKRANEAAEKAKAEPPADAH